MIPGFPMEDGDVRWRDKGRKVLVCAKKETENDELKEEKCYVWKN